MTTVINLYGGPGTGKSTSAAYIFYKLKQDNRNVELVREYVKDWAWEKRHITDFDQFYFLGKQIRRESLLYGKVDYIVTDCPVALSFMYAREYCPPVITAAVGESVKAFYDLANIKGTVHRHIFLTRSKKYNPQGRFQTEEEAKMLDANTKYALDYLTLKYDEYPTNESAFDGLIGRILENR